MPQDAKTPTFSSKVPFDMGDEGGRVLVALVCEHAPVGSQVAFSADTPLPDGGKIELPLTTVTTSTHFVAGVQVNIPARYTTTITYDFYANGLPIPPGFSIALEAVMVIGGATPSADPKDRRTIARTSLGSASA